MALKTTIKNCIIRAKELNAAKEITPELADKYWDIKQELFNTLTLWQNCRTEKEIAKGLICPPELKEDTDELNRVLWSVWHKICDAGLN